MPSIRNCAVLLALTGFVLACDRAPTDLSSREIDALLAVSSETGAARTFDSALPGLFREAIAAVEKRNGRSGVAALLADWRGLQEELAAEAASGERRAIEAKLAAIHREELDIVRRVLGGGVITRVVTETNAGMAAAGLSIEAAADAGYDVTRALQMSQEVRARLSATTEAVAAEDGRRALDHAARAAGSLERLRHHLVELQRVDGIETLFPRALDKVRREHGDDVVRALASNLDRHDARARAALRAGDRESAHESLRLARAEQIRIVHDALGADPAVRLVRDLDRRAAEIAAVLGRLETAGRDVGRHRRMLREAIDLRRRADTALAAGDATTTLDLGSHAAGLLNALQHLTWH